MRKFLVIFLGLILPAASWAEQVTEQQALQKAEQFLQGKKIQGKNIRLRRAPQRTATAASLYIFNVEDNGGFVIVSGDDCTDDILGYTEQGAFDENTLPHSFRAWLDQMTAEIQALQRSGATRRAAPAGTAKMVMTHPPIQPLLRTDWGQGGANNDINSNGVYNIHLPMINGQYTLTGCVATAAAQIMYYYQWPQVQTQSVPGYSTTSEADTSHDLPPIQFQWDKMKTSYVSNDTEAVNAVADLMLYCGYAAETIYGVNVSLAYELTMAEGMSKYFDYNPDTWQYVYRDQYSISEWDELIYNELAANRPVLYCGAFYDGHAFVCDGYDGAGLYHFNWGWNGNSNGYFKLQATNPYGANNINRMGFIDKVNCVIGLQPSNWPDFPVVDADDSWEEETIEGTVATVLSPTVEGLTLSMGFYNYNDEPCGFGFGLGLLNEDGSVIPFDTRYEDTKMTTLATEWGFTTVPFDLSSTELADGTYKLVPISLLNGEETWRRCEPADLYFLVNVSGEEMTIEVRPVEDLIINEFDLASVGTPNQQQYVRVNITNAGDNIKKNFYIFQGPDIYHKTYVNALKTKIAAGNTKEYRIFIGSMEEGTYTLWLTGDYSGNTVLAKKEITIRQDLEAIDFDIIGKKNTNRVLQVDVTVSNAAGDFFSPLYLLTDSGTDKKMVYAAGTAIEAGGQEVVTFFFRPDAAGTWPLYVATDQQGKNIIGQTTVEITESAEANLDFTLTMPDAEGDVIQAQTMVVRTEVTNNGANAYDDEIVATLYKWEPEAQIGHPVQTLKQDITLEPAATTSVDFNFDVVEDGYTYFFWLSYYSKGEIVDGLGSYLYEFQYTPTSVLMGDVNGDGHVSITDAVYVVNYVLQQPADDFCEEAADLNGDGKITITDAVQIINIILQQ
ncbi:MAG: C10 family peptidase [Bacteroidaceae bacterium]|nr:C10 family peptidase [Bacteroidaceae bacterium]